MIKLMIFDLDGTLLNSIDDLCTAANMALAYYNYPQHDAQACKYFVGNGIYKLVERSLPENARDRENVLKVKKVFDTYYKEHSQDQTRPYHGIIELLEALEKRNIHCGVVTNKAHEYAGRLVSDYFGDRIELTLGQREGIPTKPDPHSTLEMMAHFNAAPEECLYIGDSNVDIFTAQAARVKSVGVLWGFRTEEELKKAGADFIVTRPEEILNLALTV